MKKEKFIEKLLKEEFMGYIVDKFPERFYAEKRLIEKAMEYRNWDMFVLGIAVGVFIIISIAQFL